MAALIKSTLWAEVKANLGNRSDLDTRTVQLLNLAQSFIAKFHQWTELEAAATGNLTIHNNVLALPSYPLDIVSFKLVMGTDSRKLVFVPTRKFEELFPDPTVWTEGKPTHYTAFAGNAYMWRIPDFAYAYVLKYVKFPTEFATGTDVASDLLKKDELLVALTTSYAFRSLGEMDKANQWYKVAVDMLKTARAMDDNEADYDIRGDIPAGADISDYWLNPFIKSVTG